MKEQRHWYFYALGLLACVCLALVVYMFSIGLSSVEPNKKEIVRPVVPYAPQLVSILDAKTNRITQILSEKTVLDELQRMNQIHEAFSESEIQDYEQLWRSNPDPEEFESILSSVINNQLVNVTQANIGVAEIFVTSVLGLNVAQSNPTSDYIQNDEAWWQEAYADGIGTTYYGQVEFDDSANRIGIPVYISLYDSASGQLLGIVKVIIDSEDIVQKL